MECSLRIDILLKTPHWRSFRIENESVIINLVILTYQALEGKLKLALASSSSNDPMFKTGLGT